MALGTKLGDPLLLAAAVRAGDAAGVAANAIAEARAECPGAALGLLEGEGLGSVHEVRRGSSGGCTVKTQVCRELLHFNISYTF